MINCHKFIQMSIVAIILVSFSVATIRPAVAIAPPNPVKLPLGSWIMDASGEPQVLNITSVTPDGLITGTLITYSAGSYFNYLNPSFYSNIFGFWDDDAWKITFLKENQIFWINHTEENKHPGLDCKPGAECHGRDQIFTGYMFGGLPCDPTTKPPLTGGCTSGGAPISTKGNLTMAGSVEAFAGPTGTTGTGAIADRNVFGWVAVHDGTIEQNPCKCK
jgi:hypothetical protein